MLLARLRRALWPQDVKRHGKGTILLLVSSSLQWVMVGLAFVLLISQAVLFGHVTLIASVLVVVALLIALRPRIPRSWVPFVTSSTFQVFIAVLTTVAVAALLAVLARDGSVG